MHHWNNPEDIQTLIKRLVNVPSISGTAGENEMTDTIINILQEIPYFQRHPEYIIKSPIANDPLSRSSVVALLNKGSSNDTVILLSHFDVVGVEDYGHGKPFAFDPETFTHKLKSEYALTLDHSSRVDLQTGNWWFGRGVMDMKAGLAIQIALLSEWASCDELEGNVLLVATPDEERNSEGMFAAIPTLNRLRAEYDLDYQVCVCSEPNFSAYPGDNGKYIYKGSVGKLLPLVFCVGRETHVGGSLEGINASWMATEISQLLELSDDLVDRWNGEMSSPPTSLKMSDLKANYNVQTPGMAYILYNILTLHRPPGKIMEILQEKAREASKRITERFRQTYEAYGFLDGNGHLISELKPDVYTYQDLYQKGCELYGDRFTKTIQEVLEGEGDYHEISIRLATEMSKFFPNEAPFYLLMFAPPYYPHVFLDTHHPIERQIDEILHEVVHEANARFNESIQLKTYFPGLSDVSYCRIMDSDHTLHDLEANMPLLGRRYHIPMDEIMALDIPAVNIGPFGKDAHKRTERLELNYAVHVAPYLLKMAVHKILKNR